MNFIENNYFFRRMKEKRSKIVSLFLFVQFIPQYSYLCSVKKKQNNDKRTFLDFIVLFPW